MNDKYFDMVKTMAQQLDSSKLELLIEKLVSHLDNHHSLGDGNTQDLLTHICNKHGMYTIVSSEQHLKDWCASQLEAHDYFIFEDLSEVIEYLDSQDFIIFGSKEQLADYVVDSLKNSRVE